MKKSVLIFSIIITSLNLLSQKNNWYINAYVGEPTGISVEKDFLKHFSGEIAFSKNEFFYNYNISEQYKCYNVTQLSDMYSLSLITKYKINYKKIRFYTGTEIQITFFRAIINRKTECIRPNTMYLPENHEEIEKLLGLIPNIGITYPFYKDKLYVFAEASYYIPGISFRRINPQFRFGLKYSL